MKEGEEETRKREHTGNTEMIQERKYTQES